MQCAGVHTVNRHERNVMKRAATILASLLLAASNLAAQKQSDDARQDALAGQVVIKVRSSSIAPVAYAESLLEPVAARFGITDVSSWLHPALVAPPANYGHKRAARGDGLARILRLRFTAPIPSEIVARKLAGIAGIEYAEPVYARRLSYIPNDPLVAQQWYLEAVRATEAWNVVRADTSIIIAIVDSGIDPTHPEMKNALWRNWGEIGLDGEGRDRRSNGVDDDGNRLVDDWVGYDFGGRDGYSPDNNPAPYYWHGTHVAGIAAASGDNSEGIAGVAFGARLMTVKITDDEAVRDPLITKGADGILYAASMGARIINCSWGGPGFSQAEQEVIDSVTSMGSLVVAAAGNDGGNVSSYPASYRGVLSVASVLQGDLRSRFSNYNVHVGISAPGDGIYSTAPLGVGSNGYRYSSGTSMAAPVVAGASALVAMKYPELSPYQIAALLRVTADNIDMVNPDVRYMLGSGRLNLARALERGPSAVAAAVIDYSVIEERPDDVIEPGERIELRITVRNVLSAVNELRVDLSAADGTIPVDTPEEIFGAMRTSEERTSTAGVFRLRIPTPLPLDYRLPLRLNLFNGAEPIGTHPIDLAVNPNYATTAHNRTTVTFTGNGRIGFNDFPLNEQGRGFHVDSSSNLLAEGGLLVGIAPDRLADVVRSGSTSDQSQGLQLVKPYRLAFSQEQNAMIGTARFNDAHLTDLQRIGIDVELTTLQYDEPAAANMTMLLYRLHNRTDAQLENLHCALYFDWDLGPSGAFDQTSIDLERRLGYTRNTRDAKLPFAGAMLVTNEPMNFNALDNYAPPLSGGFFQVEKWNAISSGIRSIASNIGDCSMILGAGPISLAPGRDTVIVFAMLAGVNLSDMQIAADEAHARARRLGFTPGEPIILPRDLDLHVSVPNPFTYTTTIMFELTRDGLVTIDVFDMTGRWVDRITEGYYTRGPHAITYRPNGLASGAYVAHMRASDQVQTQKLMYLKE